MKFSDYLTFRIPTLIFTKSILRISYHSFIKVNFRKCNLKSQRCFMSGRESARAKHVWDPSGYLIFKKIVRNVFLLLSRKSEFLKFWNNTQLGWKDSPKEMVLFILFFVRLFKSTIPLKNVLKIVWSEVRPLSGN